MLIYKKKLLKKSSVFSLHLVLLADIVSFRPQGTREEKEAVANAPQF